MLRLYHLTQEKKFLEISTKILESQAQMAAENPFGFGFLLNTLYMYIQKPTEVTILNMENSEIHKTLRTMFLPESIMVGIQNTEQLNDLRNFPFFSGKKFQDKTTVFVCKNFTCSLPLQSLKEIESSL